MGHEQDVSFMTFTMPEMPLDGQPNIAAFAAVIKISFAVIAELPCSVHINN